MAHTISVLGAGSFGTALAIHLARREVPTVLWGRNAAQLQAMDAARENQDYLPGCKLPRNLRLEPDLAAAVATADDLLLAVPSHALHDLLDQLRPLLASRHGLLCACKGLEPRTGRLVHEVVEAVTGGAQRFAIISGPTFAGELGRGLPTAVTVASKDGDFAAAAVAALHGNGFRAYSSDDVVGVEVGGAVKNVIAIAVGIADGLALGANTRAAMITRGLAEIVRLGEALGGERDTFMGLAGLGDLVLTCTDNQSRNRRTGLALAAGKKLPDILAEIHQVVEGVRVAPEVLQRAAGLGVEMPITAQVVAVLAGTATPIDALLTLASRPPRAERH